MGGGFTVTKPKLTMKKNEIKVFRLQLVLV